MRGRIITAVILLAMLAVLLGGCVTPSEATSTTSAQPASGKVEVYVTDAPPDEEITAVLLTVSGLEIHLADAEQEQEQSASDNVGQKQEQERDQEGEGEWINIAVSGNMATFDLLEVKDIEEFFGGAEVAAGKYTQLRLVVEKAEVALDGGEPQEARVPGGEVKIVQPFDVAAGETTAILLDFDAERSVNVTGAGQIQVRPVVKLSILHEGASAEKKGQDKKGNDGNQAGDKGGKVVSLEVSYDDFQAGNHISREVTVGTGDRLKVTLGSNATTGYQWSENAEIEDTAVLEQLNHKSVAPGGKGKKAVGAAGMEEWTFRVLQEGTTTISMDYGQPWEGGEKGAWTFTLTVSAD